MKIIVTAVAAIGILVSGVALAAPAEADNCLDTVVGPAVCVPGLPSVTLPTTTAPPSATPTTPAAKTPGPAQSTHPSAPTPRQTPSTKAYTTPQPSGQASPTPATKLSTPEASPTPKPVPKHAVVTVAAAVSFSLLSLLLGAVAVLLVMYLMFHLGRREGERSVNDFIEELLMITRSRKN